MGLKRYSEKRNFGKTPEPAGKNTKQPEKKNLIFVVQKHHARNLHYDLRLEYNGALKSWAVPKGPSLNPADKRLAVEVEDHPIDYADFEGEIPKGEYGAGQVIVWDKGRWIPAANPEAAFKKGHLDFELKGEKMNGRWTLVRMGKTGPKNNWLLIKQKDEYSRTDYDLTVEEPEGVLKKKPTRVYQEFIIGGFTRSEASRPFSSILVGYYDDAGQLRYAGKVGTGYSDSTLATLSREMEKLVRLKSPFDINSPTEKNVTWLKPKLVAEIEFKTWTTGKILRQASFQGLRKDKQPKEIILENQNQKREIKITHPDRIIFPATGTTKKEVVHYYEQMATYLLPYVHDRPLSILRCQQTTAAGCYFQKHTHTTTLVGISSREVHNGGKHDSALSVENPEEIVQLIQAGTIEIHGWQASFSNIEKPDQIIFDLDPDSEKLWGRVIDTAYEIQSRLKTLGLQSFVKLTGGKGIHVHVPVQPRYTWNMIRAFSKGFMQIISESNPGYYTMNMQKQNRKGKIFLDYLRNGYGATAIIPYSLRARTQPSVALPIAWKDLKKYSRPDEILLKDAFELVKKRKDPWTDYFGMKQRIAALENYGDLLDISNGAKNLIKR